MKKVTNLFAFIFVALIIYANCGVASTAFNGSFENGLEKWRVDTPSADLIKGGIETQSDIVKSGMYALRLSGIEDEKKSLARVMSTIVPIPSTRNIVFRGWYQFDAEPNAVVEIDVIFYDKDRKPLTPVQDYWQRTRLERSKEWNQFHIPMTLHKKAHFMSVTMYYIGKKGVVHLDDLEFAPLPVTNVPSAGYALNVKSPDADFSVESPLKKVYSDSAKPTRIKNVISLSAAKGETEPMQVVLWPKKVLSNLKVTFSGLKNDKNKGVPIDILRARYVGMVDSPNQSPRGRAGAIPDVLLPAPPATIPANKPQAIWLDVRVPRNVDAGIYHGKVEISADGLPSVSLPITVEIYDFALPKKPRLTTVVHDWGTPENGKEVLWKNWREHRISGAASPIDPKIVPHSAGWNGLPPAKITPDLPVKISDDGNVSIDWTTWDAGTKKYFSQYGFSTFNVPNVFMGDVYGYYRSDDGKRRDHGKGAWFGLDVGSTIWEKAFTSYVRQVYAHLKEQDIADYAIWQIWDEARPKNNPARIRGLKSIAGIIRKEAPGAQIMITDAKSSDLEGYVNLWCFPTNKMSDAPRKGPNEKVWIYDNSLYTTDVDITPYRLRMEPWALYRNDISGLLWWAVTYWKQGLQTTVGDGMLLYPAEDGGVNDSIRWENYRDGVEDYDYLWLLAQAQDAALKKLGKSDPQLSGNALVKSLTNKMFKSTFDANVNIGELMNLRAKIAHAIVRLNNDPKAALEVGTQLLQQ